MSEPAPEPAPPPTGRELYSHVRLDLPNVRSQRTTPSNARLALGVVCMTKKPTCIITWLMHHRSLGVSKVYLRIEDTPELAALLTQPPWDEIVEAQYASGTQPHYTEQTSRQNAHVAWALPRARRAGITHLLHIDDDELLYCSLGFEALLSDLATSPRDACDLHLSNLEAYAPSRACASPYAEVRVFRHDKDTFGAYCNGKSIGRVSAPNLRSLGPHGFYFDGARERYDVPACIGVILHYESILFSAWERKFAALAASHAAGRHSSGAPTYYVQSMDAMADVESARATGDADGLKQAQAAAARLWEQWRLQPPAVAAAVIAEVEATGVPRVLACGLTVVRPLAPEIAALESSVEEAAAAGPEVEIVSLAGQERAPSLHLPALCIGRRVVRGTWRTRVCV